MVFKHIVSQWYVQLLSASMIKDSPFPGSDNTSGNTARRLQVSDLFMGQSQTAACVYQSLCSILKFGIWFIFQQYTIKMESTQILQ